VRPPERSRLSTGGRQSVDRLAALVHIRRGVGAADQNREPLQRLQKTSGLGAADGREPAHQERLSVLGADAISVHSGRCHCDEGQLGRDQQPFGCAERQDLLRFGRQRCGGSARVWTDAAAARCHQAPSVLVATILGSWIAVPGLLADQTKWLVHV